MRFITTLLIGTALALPAMAQTTPAPAHPKAHPHRMVGHTGRPGHPTPTDKGPYTSEADKAYMGGGAILEGQPGGPPPPASAVLSMPQGQPLPPSQSAPPRY